MQDKFLESIKAGFVSQIEEIINEAKSKSKEDNLSATDTLVLVNNKISSWISSINEKIHIDDELIDDELLTEIANLKKPFVSAAKKEVAMEVSKIIENAPSNVTSKINDFMNGLKEKGIDLDGDSKEDKKDTTPKTNTEIPSRTIDTSSYGSERSFVLDRQCVLKSDEWSRKTSCGGSGGCGC